MAKRSAMLRRSSRGISGVPATRRGPDRSSKGQPWTFLTNHSHVVVCLTQDSSARLRDVAARIGITERAVQKIVLDLEQAGVLRRERDGRRNRYSMRLDVALRHVVEAHCTLGELLSPILESRSGRPQGRGDSRILE